MEWGPSLLGDKGSWVHLSHSQRNQMWGFQMSREGWGTPTPTNPNGNHRENPSPNSTQHSEPMSVWQRWLEGLGWHLRVTHLSPGPLGGQVNKGTWFHRWLDIQLGRGQEGWGLMEKGPGMLTCKCLHVEKDGCSHRRKSRAAQTPPSPQFPTWKSSAFEFFKPLQVPPHRPVLVLAR